MKNLLIVLIAVFATTLLTAQNNWEAPLQAQINAAQQARTPAELQAITSVLERIALSNPTEWLPAYHAAYYNSQVFWRSGKAGCEPCLEQMDKFLTTAEDIDNNSEVLTLRANYYQAKLQGSPMMAPYYGQKASGTLEVALSEDPNNPRAHLLMGQNIYHTPAMFGGGAEKAKPFLDNAAKLFAKADATTPTIQPSWGKRALNNMNKQMASAE